MSSVNNLFRQFLRHSRCECVCYEWRDKTLEAGRPAGEVGIDDGLVIQAKEEIVEMNNGCICCTGTSLLLPPLNDTAI